VLTRWRIALLTVHASRGA